MRSANTKKSPYFGEDGENGVQRRCEKEHGRPMKILAGGPIVNSCWFWNNVLGKKLVKVGGEHKVLEVGVCGILGIGYCDKYACISDSLLLTRTLTTRWGN